MIDKLAVEDYFPENGRVLFTCKAGKVTAVRIVNEDEHVASLKSLFELAEMAGYVVVKKEKLKV